MSQAIRTCQPAFHLVSTTILDTTDELLLNRMIVDLGKNKEWDGLRLEIQLRMTPIANGEAHELRVEVVEFDPSLKASDAEMLFLMTVSTVLWIRRYEAFEYRLHKLYNLRVIWTDVLAQKVPGLYKRTVEFDGQRVIDSSVIEHASRVSQEDDFMVEIKYQ